MALDSAQLMQVLDQYQFRLHEAGNEDHDEEIEYVKQIVVSPIFHQFLRGETAQEENVQIQQATRDILSADLSTEALLSELTSSDIQKRRLARRKSLKALRNAVMPSSQHPPSKKSHHSSSSATSPSIPYHSVGHAPSRTSEQTSLSSSATTSPLKHGHHTKSYSGPESVRTAVAVATGVDSQPPHHHLSHGIAAPPPHLPPSLMTNGGGDIDTPVEGLVKSPVSPRRPPESNLLSPRIRNLSNSTNTLIERLSPPVQSPTKGHMISSGRVTAESHPNVHSLGLNRPEMDKDLFSIPRHVLSPEWASGNETRGVVNLPLHPPPHPHSHYNTPSNPSHLPHRTPVAMATPVRLPLTSDVPRHPPPAPPPSYEQPSQDSAHKRSKSFEDILNSPEFDPLNFHRTPIPPHPILGPQVENSALGVASTGQGGRNHSTLCFDIYLEKGSEGLGFLVNNREGGEGGLVVQGLSSGGPAEQDGRLKPNDIITAINGVSLGTTSHNEAVRLLQAVRGIVQLSCLRETESPLPPSPPLQPPSSPPFHSSHPPPAPQFHSSHPPPTSSPSARSPPSPLSHPSNAAATSSHPHTFPPSSPHSLVHHTPTPPHPTPPPSHPSHSPTSDSGTNSEVPDMTFNTTSGQPVRQQIRTIHLPPCEEGVGISLAPHPQGGAVVSALLDRGAAKKDGRLSHGDRLLEVNEESVIHMRSEEVAATLRSLDDNHEAIRLVVAHSEKEGESQAEQDLIPEVMDSSGDELDEFEVELYKEGRGLGITIAGLASEDTGDELKGLYITSVNAQGAVGKDGRAKVNDRILRVDGHSLRGLENMEAAAVLRKSGNPVKLLFGRPKTQEEGADGTERDDMEPEDEGKDDDVDSEQSHLHDNGILDTDDGDLGNETGEAPERETSLVGMMEVDMELTRKWKNVMGPNYEIKIARVVKVGTQGGLGISMESTAHLDETGKTQEGSTRHIITLVKAGPVKEQGELKGGDEILQVNSTEVLGLEHDQAIEVVKETPAKVMIVVARRILPADTEEGLVAESDDEKQTNGEGSAREDLLAPPTEEGGGFPGSSEGGGGGGGFGGKDISRRFERQSWRERHAEERRRLKHRFEQRREEYERHIRELEDELRQRETEQKMLMAAEPDQEGRGEEGGARERRRSTLLHPSSSPTKFDYSAYHDPVTFTYHDFTEREVRSPDSDSSLSVLSPVPGTGFWEQDVTNIQLHKGDEGLGFSILDFADPHNEGERIILVQSLVEGGVAEQDGRLRVGDRLISVNDVSLTSKTLQFAVEQLVLVPHGSMVELGIHHPVLAESDFSDSPSLSPLPPSPSSHPLPLPTSPSANPLHRDLVSTNQQFFPSHFQQGSYGGSKRRSSSLSGAEEEEEEEESEVDGEEDEREEEGEGKKKEEREDDKKPAGTGGDEMKPKGTSENSPAEEPSHSSVPRPEDAVDRRGSLSPLELSRISSPSRGMSLAEMTRVTPEDQERWRQSRESLENGRSRESLTEIGGRGTLPLRDRFGGSLEIRATFFHTRAESQTGDSPQPLTTEAKGSGDDDEEGKTLFLPQVEMSPPQKPRRGSESGAHDHSQLESSSDTTLVGSQSQSDTGMGPAPEEGGAPSRLQPASNKKTRRSPKGKKSPKHGRKKGKSGTDASNKTSPATLAVTYTHSQVTNTSSQDSIQDGLSPDMSDYDHSSELDNDPREIHIPKTSSSFGLSLMQDSKSSSILVKSVKGAIRKDGRIRVGDQILAINREWLENISLAKASKILKKAVSKSEGVTISYLPAPHDFSSNSYAKSGPPQQQATHIPPGQPPLQQNLAGGPSLQGVPPDQDSFGQQSQMPHPNVMPPQMAPPQWTSYQLGPGGAISPMQPPPYNYPPTRQPFGQPPLQPVVWQVPGSLPLGQPAPQQVTWILREPPQYVDHVVQQHHMMSATTPTHYPLSHTGPVSMTTLPPPTQAGPPQSLPSQPPPVSAQLAPPKSSSASYTQPQTTTSSSSSRMTKTQSDTKLGAGGAAKPESDRRHNSQGSPRHPPHPYTVYRRRQQQQAQAAAAAAARARQPTLVEEQPSPRGSAAARARQPTLVEEQPSPRGSASDSRNHDNSRRLQNMSRDFSEVGGAQNQQLRNSVDREVEENPELRKEFPNVEGTLFEVWLNKGNRGLGMSIVANRDDHTPGPRGIVIMGIQAGGVADRSKMVMWGDMILKINDTCVIGMTQQEVQEMLMKAPPHVKFVMLRQAEARVLERNIQQPTGGGGVDRDLINGLPQVRVLQLHRDNEKGLGFTVAQAGQGGVVTVASVAPGGPAEKEGTLQPGDQLISIDGQKILGYSAEKARHLLQQARARGWVQLIVTSRGGEGGAGGERAGGSLKSNIPESVVLRQKKKNKENSLKSSRRRPVSVDSEAGIVRATSTSRVRDLRTGGGASGGGVESEERGECRPVTTVAPMGESGERSVGGWGEGGEVGSGGGGTRNSHTLTEKEVELGFQKMEKHNVILPGRETRITIFKGSQVLGLTVVGGVDTYLHNIIIERIIPDSPAATDGRLRPGDRLLEIHDHSVREATCEDVLAALQYPSPFIHLTVLRIHSQDPQPNEVTVSPTPNVETVELLKPARGGFGLLIQESPNQSGVYVQEVVENQAAYLDGRIKAGDKILAINHTSTAVATQDTVFKLLQSCVGKVVLNVQHRDTLSPVLSTIDFPERDSTNHHFAVQPPPPGVKYPFVGEPPPSHIPNRDPPPYHPPFSSYLPDPQSRGAHPGGGMWGAGQPSSHARPQPAPLHRSGEGKIKYVKLRKGPSGLGFTIVGGAGSSHGDKPIYVNRVLEEGVAGHALFKGDQLLAINGISFEGVTHKFAADTLKQQSRHGDVELTVLSFE